MYFEIFQMQFKRKISDNLKQNNKGSCFCIYCIINFYLLQSYTKKEAIYIK